MTNELTTANILSLFETTKAERTSFVGDVIERLNNGEIEPLKIHLQIKAMEDIITQLTSTDEKKNKSIGFALAYKSHLLNAAEKYGKKFQLDNAEFQVKEVGVVYDWSKCEDISLNELLAQKSDLDKKVKAKQEFLKTVSIEGLLVTNEDTGETYKVYPPSKSSTTSLAVILK